MKLLCCSWLWLFDSVDFSNVKAAPMPTVESASSELTEGGDDDDEREEDISKDKKKRVGFRDRKVL